MPWICPACMQARVCPGSTLHVPCNMCMPWIYPACMRTRICICPGSTLHAGEHMYALDLPGALLQTGVPEQPSMACGVKHVIEPALWNAWSQLPAATVGKEGVPPFYLQNHKHIFEYYKETPVILLPSVLQPACFPWFYSLLAACRCYKTSMQAHSHTHAHARTHARAHACTHTQKCSHARTHTLLRRKTR